MKQMVFITTFSLFIVLTFQACTNKVILNSPSESQAPKSNLNGEGYSGKPKPHDYMNPDQPCPDVGANGKALPNAQIFVLSDTGAQLVRENCADITPRPLDLSEYTIDANGDVHYQNKIFARNPNESPFDVVAASCPDGKALLPNPARTSMIRDPLDLLSPEWETHGLQVTLEGSLASLPVYKVERADANSLPKWRRMAQSPELVAGESYVFSFFAKPSATEKASFIAYAPSIQDFEVEINLTTGEATAPLAKGAKLLSTKSRVFGGGIYINIYFQSLVDATSNLGVSSSGEFIGSSISATAIQLEKLSNFCTP